VTDDDIAKTAQTIEDHNARFNRTPLSPDHDLEMLLKDLLLYAHHEGIDFTYQLERAQIVARGFIPVPCGVPTGSAQARRPWPKWEGGRTLERLVDDRLREGRRAPFDGDYPEDEDVILPEPGDWAIRAARGIIDDFDDRGAAMNDAFHIEKIDHETRIEIIDVMAAIMREALRREREEDGKAVYAGIRIASGRSASRNQRSSRCRLIRSTLKPL